MRKQDSKQLFYHFSAILWLQNKHGTARSSEFCMPGRFVAKYLSGLIAQILSLGTGSYGCSMRIGVDSRESSAKNENSFAIHPQEST